MGKKAKTKATIKRQTKNEMIELGVYKDAYMPLIEIYSELREQYELLTQEFAETNYNYQVETFNGGSKKHPLVSTLEALRKDILAYSDKLGLNPRSIESVTVEKESKSKLTKVLVEMSRDEEG